MILMWRKNAFKSISDSFHISVIHPPRPPVRTAFEISARNEFCLCAFNCYCPFQHSVSKNRLNILQLSNSNDHYRMNPSANLYTLHITHKNEFTYRKSANMCARFDQKLALGDYFAYIKGGEENLLTVLLRLHK
jgi:phosphoglycerol transferase MdoB-like AlkP superfamily enzyme